MTYFKARAAGSGGSHTPVLIGTYTGNQSIDVSEYKRSTDTIDNFLVEITSINGARNNYYAGGSAASSGASYIQIATTNITKSLSDYMLNISVGNVSASSYVYGNVSPSSFSVSATMTYNLYHI